jgi:hypothetical protein
MDEKQATKLLGEPIDVGIVLLPRGAAKGFRRQGAAAVGAGVLGAVVASRMGRETQPQDDAWTGHALLALTPTRLALIAAKQGRRDGAEEEVLFAVSPGEVAGIATGKAAMGIATVDLRLADGRSFAFEMSRVMGKRLAKIADAVESAAG